MTKSESILYETDNLYLFETAEGLEIRMNKATHSVIIGKPCNRDAAVRCMQRLERYPSRMKSLA